MSNENVGMSWVGDGTEIIPNVPPRDLTPDEAQRYSEIIDAAQKNTGKVFYKRRAVRKAKGDGAKEVDK